MLNAWCLTERLRDREAQIEALTTYIRDQQWWAGVFGSHDNDDIAMDTDQVIAVADQQYQWYNSATAGSNCSDVQDPELGYSSGGSDVSTTDWKRNLTKIDDECISSEIRIDDKERVTTESHHQSVAHALHLASTIILGLLVLEVSI